MASYDADVQKQVSFKMFFVAEEHISKAHCLLALKEDF